jgi:MFS family permease
VFLTPWLISIGGGLMMIGVNLRAVDIGARIEFLGLLGAARSTTYMLSALGWGTLSDKLRKETIVLASCFLHIFVCVVTAWARTLPLLVLATVAFSITEGMLWPPFEAWVGEIRQKGPGKRWFGIYNIAWCSGLALGTGMGGIAKEAGSALPFYVAAIVSLLGSVPALWLGKVGGRIGAENEAAATALPPVDDTAWMRLSWVANFGSIFCFATIVNLFPKEGGQLHLPERLIAFLCGLASAGELLAFVFTALTGVWQGKIAVLAGAQGTAAVGLLWLGRSEQVASFVVVFLIVGLSMGIGFSSSLLFSVSSERSRGRRAGVHEAMLALGGMVGPPLCGVFAGLAGRRVPHLLSGMVLLLCILVEMQLLRRGQKGKPPR